MALFPASLDTFPSDAYNVMTMQPWRRINE